MVLKKAVVSNLNAPGDLLVIACHVRSILVVLATQEFVSLPPKDRRDFCSQKNDLLLFVLEDGPH